jgi:hypothetical protein
MSYSDKLEELHRLRAEVRRLERQAEAEAKAMSPLTEDDERRMYADQAVFDQAYVGAGRRASPPHPFERPDSYKRRLAAGLQSLSPRWARADFQKIPSDALEIAAEQVRADAIANGRTAGLRPNELRELPSTSASGHRTYDFAGGPDAWFGKQFSREPRRAVLKSQAEYSQMARDSQLARVAEVIRHRPVPQPMRTGF